MLINKEFKPTAKNSQIYIGYDLATNGAVFFLETLDKKIINYGYWYIEFTKTSITNTQKNRYDLLRQIDLLVREIVEELEGKAVRIAVEQNNYSMRNYWTFRYLLFLIDAFMIKFFDETNIEVEEVNSNKLVQVINELNSKVILKPAKFDRKMKKAEAVKLLKHNFVEINLSAKKMEDVADAFLLSYWLYKN